MREARSKLGMPVWRQDEDGRPISLMITRAGRDAIGVEEDVLADALRPNNKAYAEKRAATAEKRSKHRSGAKVPFTATLPLRKGISHAPSGNQAMDETRRSALLTAIARSKEWVATIVKDPATDIGTIAKREKLADRHIRFLAPLAYLFPRIIEAIAAGRASADLTVTGLIRNLPIVWAEQEKRLGFA